MARPTPPLAELLLGLIPGTPYQQTVVDLAPGDFVILYTDAVFEAANGEGEELGLEGLLGPRICSNAIARTEPPSHRGNGTREHLE